MTHLPYSHSYLPPTSPPHLLFTHLPTISSSPPPSASLCSQELEEEWEIPLGGKTVGSTKFSVTLSYCAFKVAPITSSGSQLDLYGFVILV